jgi:hypothetical protein
LFSYVEKRTCLRQVRRKKKEARRQGQKAELPAAGVRKQNLLAAGRVDLILLGGSPVRFR